MLLILMFYVSFLHISLQIIRVSKGWFLCKLVLFFTGIAEYVYSKRGNKLILLSGYSFYRQRTASNNKTRWACATHQQHGCRAVVYTIGDDVISGNLGHSHAPKVNWVREKPTHYVQDFRQYNCLKQFVNK